MKTIITLSITAGLAAVLLSGCNQDASPSLFDPDVTSGAQPVINDVVPADSAYAVINNITFMGSNFSSVPEENFVYFENTPGTVLNASEVQLTVKPPYLLGRDLKVKIAVHGAELFSEEISYDLLDPAPPAANFSQVQAPWAITTDAQNNIYASLTASGAGQGVKKIDTDGTISDYAPKGGETYFSSMKIGPGGVLYAVRQVRALFMIPAGGGNSSTWAVIPDNTVRIADLDFDENRNCWAVGNNNAIFRIEPDKTIHSYAFTADLKAVRVFSGYVYAAGNQEGHTRIWRFAIDGAGDLGEAEVYFDYGSAYPGYALYAMTFAADGDCYLGTDGPESVVTVHSDGTAEALYQGLFENTATIQLAWGTGNDLFMTRAETGEVSQTILKVAMNKPGAPYFGRD